MSARLQRRWKKASGANHQGLVASGKNPVRNPFTLRDQHTKKRPSEDGRLSDP